MPTPNRAADFYLNDKPYMVARDKSGRLLWKRSGQPDGPTRHPLLGEMAYGDLPNTLDHPEVWDDFSGGYGEAYRRTEQRATVHWSRGFDLRFGGMAFHAQAPRLLAGTYATTAGADMIIDIPLTNGLPGAGQVLLAGGTVLSRLTPNAQAYGAAAFDATMSVIGGRAYGHRAALLASFVYVPQCLAGTFAPFLQVNADTTFAGVFAPMPATWFVVAGGRLWRGHSKNLIQSCSIDKDPTATGNWGATLSIGNGYLPTQDAVALGDQIFVGMPDGLYMGDATGTFSNVATDIGAAVNTDNIRDLTVHEGGVVFGEGAHIWKYTPSQGGNAEMREIGPTAKGTNRSPIRGRFTCVTGYGKWLYAGLFTGSGSFFLAGRDASPGLPYVWYPLNDLLGLNTKISRIHVDGVTVSSGNMPIPNRIWVATDATYGAGAGATAPVFYWPVPAGDENPLSDTNFSPNYMGSARLDLGLSDWQAPGATKLYRAEDVVSEGLSTGAQYADLYAFTDQFDSRTSIGRFDTSPKQTQYRIVQDLGGGLIAANTGQAMGLSLDSFTASAGVTPVYRALVSRGLMRPPSVDVIEAGVRLADNIRDRQGQTLRPGSVQQQEIHALASAGVPAKMVGLLGEKAWVSVLNEVQETPGLDTGDEQIELTANIKMAVLDFGASAAF